MAEHSCLSPGQRTIRRTRKKRSDLDGALWEKLKRERILSGKKKDSITSTERGAEQRNRKKANTHGNYTRDKSEYACIREKESESC